MTSVDQANLYLTKLGLFKQEYALVMKDAGRTEEMREAFKQSHACLSAAIGRERPICGCCDEEVLPIDLYISDRMNWAMDNAPNCLFICKSCARELPTCVFCEKVHKTSITDGWGNKFCSDKCHEDHVEYIREQRNLERTHSISRTVGRP